MSVLTLAEAKAHLRMKESDNDTGLQDVIDDAEGIAATIVGPLTVGASSTVRVQGGYRLILPVAPIGTVTAVTTPDGQTLDLSLLSYNKPAGIVYFTDNRSGFSSAIYDVTYTSGYTTIPGDIMWGIKELVRELWKTQRGARTNTTGDPGATLTDWRQWLEPYRLPTVGAW